MKNEKFCFSKGTGLIALVGILLVGFVLLTQAANQQTSTSSRADLHCATVKDMVHTVVNVGTGYSEVYTGLSNGTGGCATKRMQCVNPVVNQKCKTPASVEAEGWDTICKAQADGAKDAKGKSTGFLQAGVCLVFTGGYSKKDGSCITRKANSTDNTDVCAGKILTDINFCEATAEDATHKDATSGKYIGFKQNGVCLVYTGGYSAVDGHCMTRNANSTDDTNTNCGGPVASDVNGCALLAVDASYKDITTGKYIAFKNANDMCVVYTGGYSRVDGRCLVRGAKSTDITNNCSGNVISDVLGCAASAVDGSHKSATSGKYIGFKQNGACLVYTGGYSAVDGHCMTRNANSTDDITACQVAGNDPKGCAAKAGTLDPASGHYFNGRFNPNTGICYLD